MHRPPTSPLPIQLLPQVPRALSIIAAGLSLSLHGSLLALAVAGTGNWITPQPGPITMRQPTIGAVTYLVVIPPAQPSGRSQGRAAPRIGRSRSATPSESRDPLPRLLPRLPPFRPAALTLTAPARPLVLRTGAIGLVSGDKLVPTNGAGTEGKGIAVGRNDVTMSAGPGKRGTSRVAELLTNPGEACPELRRPAHLDSEVDLEVAVKFIVDSLGAVDRTTLRIVNAPGTVDADYRGEIQVILINLGHESYTVERGMRVAQLVIAATMQTVICEAASLDDTTRGAAGFGSTGTGR